MSRHRGVKDLIDEALDAEDYYQQEEEDQYYEEELDEESEGMIAEVLDAVGKKDFNRKSVIMALDDVEWDVDEAVNAIVSDNKKYKKKKPKKGGKGGDKPDSQQPNAGNKLPQQPQNQKSTSTNSKEESKSNLDLEHQQSDEHIPFRKRSDEHKVVDVSKFLNKSTYNNPVPEVEVPKEIQERVNKSKYFYVVVCGHVDSGKSTLVGHMLYTLGEVDKQTMHKYEKESSNAGKSSFKYAWVLDERPEERARGVTIDVGMRSINLGEKKVIFLDAPGHREFVPNMISGTAQADCALLVVDAVANAFDAGFCRNGQTREHAVVVRSMGIENIIVAVNKVDLIDYSRERFDYISASVCQYLSEIGFKEDNITVVPISGLTGDNVEKRSKKPELGWYEGFSLLEVLSFMNPVSENLNKPFRLYVNSFYHQPNGKIKGDCISGKVIAGYITKGQEALVTPCCAKVTIKDIFVDDEKQNNALVGENVTLVIKVQEYDAHQIKMGNVLCPVKQPTPVATRLNVDLELYEFDRPMIRGERTMIHIGLNKISAVIQKINYTIKKENGEIAKKQPKFITNGQMANVDIMCERGIVVELFKNYPHFGRIVIREKQSTIGSGIIIKIVD